MKGFPEDSDRPQPDDGMGGLCDQPRFVTRWAFGDSYLLIVFFEYRVSLEDQEYFGTDCSHPEFRIDDIPDEWFSRPITFSLPAKQLQETLRPNRLIN